MKRSVEWYADHKARMDRQRNGIGNAELVQVTRIGKASAHVAVKLSGERYPNLLIMLHEQSVPAPVTEYPFAGNRRWRFDYCWPFAHVALEVDGGAWTQGRHTRGEGFIQDQDKRNAAVMLGWKVIHTTPDRLEDAVRCVRLLMSGSAA